MSMFPVQVFTKEEALVGANDDYKSSLLGRKFAGNPKGVYIGFLPAVSQPSPIVTLTIGGVEGVSLIKIPSSAEPAGLDIVVAQSIQLDFTGQPDADFPIHIVARAAYTDSSATATTADIFTRSAVTTGQLLSGIGGTPTAVDLATLSITAASRMRPTTVTLNFDVDGVGPIVVVDDGNGNFPVSAALPSGGTINYSTGAMIGTTALLTSGSFVTADFSITSNFDEVIICEVIGTPTTLVVLTNPRLGQRDEPLALSNADFGYMPAGGIEDLIKAVDFVNETVAARVGLDNTVHSSLSARLAADQSAISMASRLAPAFRSIRSNDVAITAGAQSVNVSGSFTSVDRAVGPLIDIGGLGGETVSGAVAAPNDTQRNVCVIVSAITGDRPIDDDTARNLVFGRLSGPTEIAVAGTLSFSNALTGVTGVGSNFSGGSIQVGDTLQGADGLFYEIASIESASALTLSTAYQGVDATSGNLVANRWTLALRAIISNDEVDSSLAADTTIRFFFPAFLEIGTSNFDNRLVMHAPAEREPLPRATTTIPGRVVLPATTHPSGAALKLGAVEIENIGITLSNGPYHTVNFSAAQAVVITGVSTGEVIVDVIGNEGPAGPEGLAGQPGPAGEQGDGFETINEFEITGNVVNNAIVPAPANVSFTLPMGLTIKMAACGIARWIESPFFSPASTEITLLTLPTIDSIQIDVTNLQFQSQTSFFVVAAGLI